MKTCIITGASSGIGRATAIKMSYLKEIKNIVLISRRKNELIKTQKMMNPNTIVYVTPYDLEDLKGIPKLIEEIYRQTGSIDILLNISGYTNPQSLLDTTVENIIQTYNINVFSAFLMIRECVKYMRGKNAKILNVASTAGIIPRPGWLAYSSSKAALIAMSETLAEELVEYKIKVYCISPGRCATNLRKKLAPDEDPTTIMQPEEVAEVIKNMMQQSESCLDGQNIIVRKTIV